MEHGASDKPQEKRTSQTQLLYAAYGVGGLVALAVLIGLGRRKHRHSKRDPRDRSSWPLLLLRGQVLAVGSAVFQAGCPDGDHGSRTRWCARLGGNPRVHGQTERRCEVQRDGREIGVLGRTAVTYPRGSH